MSTLSFDTSRKPDWRHEIGITALFLRLLASLLLFAAGAKAYAGWQDHNAHGLLWMQATMELALGAWLASGVHILQARRIALIAFVVFAFVSLFKVFQRASSCGCFGTVRVSPSFTFGLDLTIVVLLVLARPFPKTSARKFDRRVAGCVCVSIMGIAALTVARHWTHPAVQTVNVTDAINGIHSVPSGSQGNSNAPTTQPQPDVIATPVSATEWIADVHTVPPSKTLSLLFRISSPTGRPLQIRGVNVQCNCTSVPNPPRVIPATGTADVEVRFKTPAHADTFESEAILTTDNPQLPPLTLRIKGDEQ